MRNVNKDIFRAVHNATRYSDGIFAKNITSQTPFCFFNFCWNKLGTEVENSLLDRGVECFNVKKKFLSS